VRKKAINMHSFCNKKHRGTHSTSNGMMPKHDLTMALDLEKNSKLQNLKRNVNASKMVAALPTKFFVFEQDLIEC
jgi:hypothetical protein